MRMMEKDQNGVVSKDEFMQFVGQAFDSARNDDSELGVCPLERSASAGRAFTRCWVRRNRRDITTSLRSLPARTAGGRNKIGE
jgi:hypothetical protein